MIELAEAAVEGRLEPTSLRLEEGRIAIVGSNGSGKSTLARLVNGLVEPTSGQVLVDGLDTRRHGREVRRRVGFVFTDPAAQLVMPTVAEDVALSLRKRHRDKAERAAAVLAVLERFGLADLAERSVHALSGGQRQLLAIATVLATDPDVLVADEPTTLLDLANTRRVGDVLLGLPQQVVLVTHDLDLAARCDRALVVHAGRVAFDGPAATAVDHYRALVS
ncbi:energy-coupling factor ABC transporter ATP-binding protein [Aeromicrobium sp. HA]|uniref:energy-coupling factor ABC transporter ATP-binding protein n=1 Tax=Aeromicrobium sp. HA TaxID=3009077 RepID=UPI0022AF16C8|nr:ABC transporter ATP-binding protein [Aeromicrobium sp. HA]